MLPAVKRPSRITRQRDRRVKYMASRIRQLAPHTDNPLFAPLVQSYCRLSIMLVDVYERLKTRDPIGPDGSILPAISEVRSMMLAQSRMAQALNLTPQTLHAISKEKSVNTLLAEAVERVDRIVGEHDE